jgi:hypothetical protein
LHGLAAIRLSYYSCVMDENLNVNQLFLEIVEGMGDDIASVETIQEDERREQQQKKLVHSVIPRTFENFKVGDTVILYLVGETNDDGSNRPLHFLSGTLADKKLGLIDVKDSTAASGDDISEELTGQRIGLGFTVSVTSPEGKTKKTAAQRRIAGNHEVAYYHASDMVDLGFGEKAAPNDKIRHLNLKYGRATIAGVVLFDFISTPEQQ